MTQSDPSWFDIPAGKGMLRFSSTLAIESANTPENFNALLFDPSNPALKAQPVSVGGRQAAWFVQGVFGQAVLRHYRRGGLIARLVNNRYLWLGASRTRSMQEFSLMHSMSAQGLPVPRPLAAAFWKKGFTYRAAIVVARLPNVMPLAKVLDSARPEVVATAIKAMHDANVWHADLNAFNILLDPQGQAWLIDFDRGCQKNMNSSRRRSNLLRLRRSLNKVAGSAGERYWHALEQAYWSRPSL